MYSEKLMKLFRKPHNFGKIKNPDGVGKVGNPVCVLPETMVFCNDHIRPINEIDVGGRVLSHDGRYHEVKKTFRRRYSGEVIVIKNKLGITALTPDHHVLAIKKPSSHRFNYTRNKKHLVSSWCHASELKRRDILLYPILKEIVDVKEIPLLIVRLKFDFKSKNLPKKIKVDKDFLRLAGYFIAEGSTRCEKCKTYLIFTFGSSEKSYVEDTKRLVKKIFGLDAKIVYKPEHNSVDVVVYSAALTRFFRNLFGDKAENKHIPHFMMLLPAQRQKSLILGLWRGDGYTGIANGKWPRAGYSTVSHRLVQQIKILLLRQKISPSFYEEKEKVKDGVHHQKSYRIHVSERESVIRLADILGIRLKFVKNISEKTWFDSDFLYAPITEKEIHAYKGFVNNLEIDKPNSYISESATLHNCGDVMYLYLKIKDERIKDVKFETFGCAAAIGTSSIITDMIKGKTIEDALKVSKEDIASELGGLPPIKMHCSVLATEALKKAVEDYRMKQGKKK
jgi:NifU-like protein involved in Fe-S cluster formation